MNFLEQLNRPPQDQQARAKIYGAAVGIVTNNNDPDGLGRVKLRFPWLSDQDESHWARIATLMAGHKRGTFFLPEVEDEVLVAFENGNLETPYVIGCLWNGKDKPPLTNDDQKNNIRQITSRSGHTITLDDNKEKKKEKIIIKTALGHTLELDDTDGKGAVSITTNAGHCLELDDDGETATLSDKAGNEIVIDAGDNSVNITCSGKVTLAGKGGVVIDAQDIKLGSSASMTLVNDTFLDIFNSHFHAGNMGAPTSPPTVPAVKNVQSTMTTKGA